MNDAPSLLNNTNSIMFSAHSPMGSVEATDFEVSKLVYHAFTERVKAFQVNPQPATGVWSNMDTFQRSTMNIMVAEEVKPPSLPSLNVEKVKDSFIALQSWEGYIKEIYESDFVARLTDIKTGVDEDARLPIKMVSGGDQQLLQVGAVFYWSIGYLRDWTSRIHTQSELRFRRLNRPTESDFQVAVQEAQELSNSLGFTANNDERPSSRRS